MTTRGEELRARLWDLCVLSSPIADSDLPRVRRYVDYLADVIEATIDTRVQAALRDIAPAQQTAPATAVALLICRHWTTLEGAAAGAASVWCDLDGHRPGMVAVVRATPMDIAGRREGEL